MEKKNLTKKDKIVYALIVLMGVAAFIISTIWLCKTEEAEAATNKYVLIDGKQYDYSGIENFESILSSCDELMTRVPDQFIISSNFQYKSAGSPYVQYSGYHINVSGDKVVSVENANFTYPFSGFYYASFDCTDRGFSKDLLYMAYPTIVSLPTYTSSGPYSYFPSIYFNDGTSNLEMKGDVYSDQYEVDVTFQVQIPAFMQGTSTTGAYFKQAFSTPIGFENYMNNLSFGDTFSIPLSSNEVTLVSEGIYSYSWNFQECVDYIQTKVQRPLYELYGLTESEWNTMGKLIMGKSRIFRIDTVTYNYDPAQDTLIYGPVCSSKYNSSGKLTYAYKIEKDVNDITDADHAVSDKDALQDMLDERESEIDDLKEQLNNIQMGMQGFGGNLSETELWSSFENLSNGLMSIGGSIKKVAYAAGACFAFLPGDMTSLIWFGIVAILIIGIVKMIRG